MAQDQPKPTGARPGFFSRLRAGTPPRQDLLGLPRLAQPNRTLAEAEVRATALAVPLGDTLLCRVLGRYKMLLDPADRGFTPHLAVDGYWKFWLTCFLTRQLRPGQRLLEAGAGYGYFTLLVADLVGPRGQVTALEPNPPLAALLRRNVALNGMAERVRVERLALATHRAPDFLPFRAHAEDPLAGHLVADEEGGTIRVPTTSLERYTTEPLDWLRLDLNGAEEAVLADLPPLLQARPGLRVLLEFAPSRCNAPAALLATLAGHFRLQRVEANGEARPCDAASLLAGGNATLYLSR